MVRVVHHNSELGANLVSISHNTDKLTNVPAAYPLVSLFWSWFGTATLGHYVFSDYGQTLQTAQLVIFPFL